MIDWFHSISSSLSFMFNCYFSWKWKQKLKWCTKFSLLWFEYFAIQITNEDLDCFSLYCKSVNTHVFTPIHLIQSFFFSTITFSKLSLIFSISSHFICQCISFIPLTHSLEVMFEFHAFTYHESSLPKLLVLSMAALCSMCCFLFSTFSWSRESCTLLNAFTLLVSYIGPKLYFTW